MDISKALEVSKKAAVDAGNAIMDIYENSADIGITYKEGNMPLTKADKASDKIICDALRKSFPEAALLSEEEKDNRSRLDKDYCFIVDPLDGTKEFIKRNGQFTVNIALSYRHHTVMGVIYVPVSGELFYASKDNGSFYERTPGETPVRLHVSENTDLNTVRLVMSSSHGCKEMDDLIKKYGFKNFVKMGSSLKGCLVAKGDAEIYYRFNPTMEWDTAAMQCIAEEAGAVFRQTDDSEMLYNRENSLNDKGFYIINDPKNKLSL